ncbi:hypothetical protein [Sulfoacidibacillus thermotolerans]|nr:hypothetical protein [Sulfoacidibacillus thermotolerans]
MRNVSDGQKARFLRRSNKKERGVRAHPDNFLGFSSHQLQAVYTFRRDRL